MRVWPGFLLGNLDARGEVPRDFFDSAAATSCPFFGSTFLFSGCLSNGWAAQHREERKKKHRCISIGAADTRNSSTERAVVSGADRPVIVVVVNNCDDPDGSARDRQQHCWFTQSGTPQAALSTVAIDTFVLSTNNLVANHNHRLL